MRAFGIDGSSYIRLDWDVAAPHLDFVWWRASAGTNFKDPTFADACQQAYDRNIPFGAYHYYNGQYYTQFPYNDFSRWPKPENDLHLQNFVGALKFKAFQMVCVDIEEYGNENVSPAWMSHGAQVFVGRVWDWLRVNKPGAQLFVYTRNSYIDQYAPNINNWIHNYNSWIAQWWYNPGSVSSTWDEVKAKAPGDAYKPKHFSTRPTWEMWQWSGDRFIVPGVYNSQGVPRPSDFNSFNGTREELRAWLKLDAPPPPQPPEPEPEPQPDPALYVTHAEFDAFVKLYAVHTHATGAPNE